MATGKTTFGKQLANALGYQFIDLDSLIEKEVGTSIATIFASKGEAYFRDVEKVTLHKTTSLQKSVIACGGGTPCFFDNIDYINANGISIWLKVPIHFIIHRLENAKTSRPLVAPLNNTTLEAYVEKHLRERTIYYERCSIIYDTELITKNDFIIFVKYFIQEKLA